MRSKLFKHLVVIIFTILLSTFSLYAKVEKPLLRFGIWNNSNTAIVKDNGDVSGFEPELFKEVSKHIYADVEIKVYKDKNTGLQALKDNDVDVLMSSLYTESIDEEFDFTTLSVRNVDAILCSVNNQYAYQEYDAMKNKTIGYLDRGKTLAPILEYLNGKIENPILIPFDTVLQIQEAIESNQIDLCTFGMGALKDNFQILDRFYALPTYYITREGESSLLNKALSMFFNNSEDIYSSLYYKFYPRSITIEFTREELNFIDKHKQINVATGFNKNVFSSLDKNKNIVGIFPDIINEINSISGLNLQILENRSSSDLDILLDSGVADMAIGLDGLKDIQSKENYIYCYSGMSIPMKLIVDRSTVLNKNMPHKIAILKKDNTVDNFVKSQYPYWQIIYEQDFNKRYDLLLDGKVDCLIDSIYSFNYLKTKANYHKLTSYPVELYSSDITIAIQEEEGLILSKIVNKSLSHLKKNNLNQIIENNISNIVYTPTFFDMLVSHRLMYLGIIALLLLLFTVFYIINSKKKHTKLTQSNVNLLEAEHVAIEANKSKSIFLARMSHDMRTPLGAIIGLADFGKKEAESDTLKSYFVDIDDSATYLLSLIDDILDSQKLQSDDFEFKYTVFNLTKAIQRIKTIIESKANEKSISLSISGNYNELEKYIYGDSKRITQIFINILNNSIKYTNTGGRIDWNIDYKITKSNRVEISSTISDTGVGMSKSFLKNKLFNPFAKEENSLSESEGGTGLGLNICKKLIDQMKGSISCESIVNEGTTFTINLPLEMESEKKTIALNNSKIDMTTILDRDLFNGIKILVCDDTKINIKIITKILSDKKILVDTAYNGQEAIDKAKKNSYDAILMDIRMPIINGLEATKVIRHFNTSIPIIAFSANAYAEDINNSLAAGMNAHIAKPINNDNLFKVLKELIFDNNKNK